MAIADGSSAVANGGPLIGTSAPLLGVTAYADTVFDPEFATKTYLPVGSTATDEGCADDANGDPAKAVKTPAAPLW